MLSTSKRPESSRGLLPNYKTSRNLPEHSFEALVEALTPTPDPAAATFQPVKQRTASKIMYTGDGFLPEDWYFFHSKVT